MSKCSTENDAWGVQWDDGVIEYPTEEIARYEQRHPTRPEHVNPVLVRRVGGEWHVFPPATTERGEQA